VNDFGLDLAIIGNGRTAALVDPLSRIVWWCYPRFDGDPIFSRLLAGDEEKGFCDVVLEGMVEFSSDYVRNTAIVSTVLTNVEGASIRITDFAPRFREYDRIFRPPQLMRIIEPTRACLASPSGYVRPAVTALRWRSNRWAAIT
jgi:GH15 family glucan-1,4-alpha-glucosidase